MTTTAATAPAPLPVDVVGVAHVAGKYHLTDADFLNEGADVLHEMGCRVIKVWLADVAAKYPFNSTWPVMRSLVDVARSAYFRKLFDHPFDTFVLEALWGRTDDYWRGGMSPAQVDAERNGMRDLAAHLIETYRDTGKTFVLQNWEGDWALRGGSPTTDPSPGAVRGMIDWLNARQDGVDIARDRAKGVAGVTVLHAAEVNLVERAMRADGGVTVTNDVLPHTRCDLYSYSAYDVPTHEPARFRAALDYLASKAPGGKSKIYVGEYGAPENEVGGSDEQGRRVRSATQTALDWGARYAIYWQLYCNEPRRKFDGRPKNDDLKGFWLIRPDESRPAATDYFIELWNKR
jgi:hypothetical protein